MILEVHNVRIHSRLSNTKFLWLCVLYHCDNGMSERIMKVAYGFVDLNSWRHYFSTLTTHLPSHLLLPIRIDFHRTSNCLNYKIYEYTYAFLHTHRASDIFAHQFIYFFFASYLAIALQIDMHEQWGTLKWWRKQIYKKWHGIFFVREMCETHVISSALHAYQSDRDRKIVQINWSFVSFFVRFKCEHLYSTECRFAWL